MIGRRGALGLLGGLAATALMPSGLAARASAMPPRLRPGDTVGLVAPASAVTLPAELDRAVHWISGMGLVPKLASHVGDQHGYLAGTDADRAADLLSRLTISEKLALLHAKPGTDGCAFEDSGVPRLDIPIYGWTEEANTGADSSCIGPDRCATTFASPANLAASFNRSLWRAKGAIVSEEIRALNNVHGHRGCGPPAMIGINEWGPK